MFNKLNKLFNKGVNTMPSGDKYLNPTKLANEIYASKGMIEEQFGKDMWKTLKAEADFYKKMSPYWRPPSSKSVLQKSAEGMGRMAVPTTLAFTHPVLIPVVEGFGAISSWALTGGTDKKILKQMTRYLVKPAAKTGLHMAGNPLLF